MARKTDVRRDSRPRTPELFSDKEEKARLEARNGLEYVNESWAERSALHLAAYLMWRVNWIHPFAGGNGRTSRAVSYLVLCARLGYRLPGTLTVPDQIVEHRDPYYAALDAADLASSKGTLDVSVMEELLSNLLARQLVGVHSAAAHGAFD